MDPAKLYPSMREEIADDAEAPPERGGPSTTREGDLGSKLYPSMRETSGRPAGWDDQVADWERRTREDAEIGRDRLDETLQTALGVISKYGAPSLLEDLEEHGFGSHPDLIRLLSRVGRDLNRRGGS